MYSRELLDFWLRVVAVGGTTFREAYDYSKVIASSASVRYLRWGGNYLQCNRSKAHLAFGLYSQCIEYPDESRLMKNFSYSNCEVRD